MRLKSVTMHGFKTFVQRTQLELDSGITAVVGPNGSGKSNLADAVRWALGEQSLRALRCRRTEEVLFGGGNGRPPSGLAEVVLTFEAIDKENERSSSLPFAELSLARRAYRSGDSEYFVNRERVRLKDVLDVYGQLGLGLDGFALVGQGAVDAALSVRSEDRRELVAQAAGIGHLQTRLAESVSKLNQTEQNLTRVTDVIEELIPRLRTLERQARQAREREALQDEFSRGLVRYYADRWHEPWSRRCLATRDLAHATEAFAANQRLRSSREVEREEATRQLEVAVAQLGEANIHLETIIAEHAALTQSVTSDDEHLIGLARRQSEVAANARHWLAALAEETTALEDLDRQRVLVAASIGELTQSVAAASSVLEKWEPQRRSIEDSIRVERIRVAKVEARRSTALARANALEERLAHLAVTVKDRQKQITSLESDAKAQRKAVGNLETAVEIARVGLAGAEDARKVATDGFERAGQAATDAANAQREFESEFQAMRARADAIRSVDLTGAGYFPGVRAVLLAARQRPTPTLSGIIDIVARLLDVPLDLEVAVETALGSHTQDIVVARWADAEAAISLLKSTGSGRATFLPLDTLRPPYRWETVPVEPGVLGIASSLVGIDPSLAKVSEFLLGQTLLVNDLTVARRVLQSSAPFWQIVTREGELARPSGIVTGGSAAMARGALARQRELRSADRLEADMTARRDTLELEHALTRLDLEKTRSVVAEAEKQYQITRNEEQRAQELLREAQRQLDRSGQLVDAQRVDERRSVADRARLEEQCRDARQQAESAAGELETATKALSATETRASTFSDERGIRQSTVANLQGRLDVEQRRLVGFDADRARIEARRQSIGERIREHDLMLEECRADHASVGDRLDRARQRLVEQETELADARNLETDRQNAHAEKKNLSEEVGSQRRASEAEALRFEAAVHDVTARLDRAEVEIDGLRRQILLELGSIDDAELDDGVLTVRTPDGSSWSSSLEALPASERLRERLETLRSRLRLMTAGVDAVQEFEELRNRVDFLRTQVEDLGRSADTLRQAIDETQATMRSRFDVTFAQVSASFTRRFSELFGGGTARLVLDQEGDGMGIDVIAQPPGKRSQSLATLSGGERALTAASLLFALIETSPPPFCLLDEVDAALDETNVARFCDSLRNLSSTTQFLIITHNRRTMEAASALWGLTLEGRTETRVLSTRLPSDSLDGSMLH